MKVSKFEVSSEQLDCKCFESVRTIIWGTDENTITLEINDSNKNYAELIDIFKITDKIAITIQLFTLIKMKNKSYRKYNLDIIPIKLTESDLSLGDEVYTKLIAKFKVLNSQIAFND